MEARDGERVVIARPVASRPSCSSLNSFSGLLSGAISTSTPGATPIRPKTVRIKSAAINRASEANVSSKGFSSERGSNSVYKPLAKLVSSKTVQLLANMDNLDIRHLHAVQSGHSDQHIQTQVPSRSKLYQKPPSQPKTSQTNEPSHAASQNLEESQRAQLSTSGDRSSFDGYNWRKYGQKQVKGSEYPRSYYKCTHPSCPVKKKVERSLDGHIAEIVYKGEHSHSKPQPPKRHSSGLQEHGVVSDVSGQETGNPSWSTTREGSERRIENKNESKLAVNLSYSGVGTNPYDSVIFGAFSSGAGVSGDCEEGSRGGYAEHDEPKVKRRKNDHQFSEVGILGQGGQDPRVLVQSSTDSEVLVDGFCWRKYGQKVVKGNSYPRSYYRCTSIKCNVRKHVERAVDDPRAFITTYEGKHNHEMPSLGNLNPGTSDPDSAAHSNKSKL